MVGRELSGSGRVAPAVADRRAWVIPSLQRRFGALMVDWIASVLISSIFVDPVRQGWAPVLVLVVDYTLFVGLFGRTPGMWIASIRCVSVVDGRPVGLLRGLLRACLLALFVPALIMDEDRRGVHDQKAGTVVLEDR